MDDIKKIDIKEFREKGFLQEANRLFFHPLGLAMEILIEEDGSGKFSGIWDYREDPEGVLFVDLSSEDAKEKAKAVKFLKDNLEKSRLKLLGFSIQPIGNILK